MRKIIAGLLLAGTATVAQAQTFNTLGAGNTLVTSTVAAPGTNSASRVVTGLATGDNLVGIDYRPAQRRVLYGMSQSGRLYAINPNTGTSAQVGAPGYVPAGAVGFDFNPQVDRIRVVTTTGQNVRLNPTVTGTTSTLAGTDGTLAYADGTVAIPTVSAAAYSNNNPGSVTTNYAIDTRGGVGNAVLVTQGTVNGTVSPNTGQLYTVGSLGVGSTGATGFDIVTGANGTNTAYATLTNAAGDTSLYSVNLTTGAATLIGSLAGDNVTYNGLAFGLAPFQSFGTTPNQQAVGAVLDTYTGAPSAELLALFDAIDATPADQQGNALSQLSPASFSLLPDIALNAIDFQETNVLRYLRDLRGNAVRADGTNVTIDDAGRVGMFIQGGARFGSFDANGDRPQVNNDSQHVVGGIDFRVTPRILLGAMGGWGNSDVRLNANSQQSRLQNWFAGAYTTVGVGPFYVDAFGSYTDLDWDLNRSYAFGGIQGNNTANAGGRIWAAGGATGLSFSVANFEVEPFAALRYAAIRIDGFTETGSVAALNMEELRTHSLRLNLGGRLGTKFDVGGATVRVQGRGGWLKEFERDDARTMTVNFTGTGIAAPFAFTTTPLSSEYYNAGAALNIAGNGPFSVVADYDVQFDDDRQFHAVSVGGRLAF